ncbi:hypothetical protein [Bradyrhizobium icense]|uniref:Uncharacterized protein n=1 Tax=Bradyrhizobium icense TaxID=1274631 RepID=A0A1B1U9A8_9BRAD|nr:hypothetical protein [Bradyrhizobium icense]ANV99359.1 hypothetical protein LMTR13_03360 [Bradyrhizobium icense]
MANSPLGVIKIPVDGAWDIEDLRDLSESLSETYGLFYPLVAADEDTRERLQDLVRKHFWSGDIESRHFGRRLYKAIPEEDSLKLKSFRYASPGLMELSGVLMLLLLLSRVARSWIATGSAGIDLWKKVDDFFKKRKQLQRPKKKFEMSDELADHSDDARELVFEVGKMLGFDNASCVKLINVVGNPISALKFLVAAANEARKLADLQKTGLLVLPQSDAPISIQGPETATQRTREGIPVERRRRRRKTEDEDEPT